MPSPGSRRHLRALNNRLIFTATCLGVRVLPRAISAALGHVGTWIAYRLHRRGTAALIDNFHHMFPERSEAELRALALRTFRSYANDSIDFLRGVYADTDALRALMAGDAVPIESRMAGAILLCGHFGNWELAGVLARRLLGCELAVMTLPEASDAIGEQRRSMRQRLGIETVEVRKEIETALHVRRLLREGYCIAMLADRYVERDRVPVTFFGRTVYFLRSPALMAYFTGAPLIPTFMVREPGGRFRGVVGDPIVVSRTDNRETAIQAAMQRFATVLEAQVRQRPHLWYHFYAYWADQGTSGQGEQWTDPSLTGAETP